MSGTIVIDGATFVDLRTVDFLRIVAALRAQPRGAATVADRLLETVDTAGINMICADELGAVELAAFAAILEQLHSTVGADDPFGGFLAGLAGRIRRDARLSSKLQAGE
jgi:hypothetical protein